MTLAVFAARAAQPARAGLVALLLCGLGASAQPPGNAEREEKPRLAVSELAAQGVEPAEAAAITDALVSALSERKLFQVLSSKDVAAIVGAERQRQLLGQCGEEPNQEKCLSDFGELLNTPFLITGSLSKIGSAYQLSLQTIDTVKGRLIGRSTRLAGDLTTLTLLIPYAAAEATGSPLPPPRSRGAQYSMMAGGSALVIGGGVLGMLALSREQVLNQELCPPDGVPDESGVCHGRALRTMEFYEEQNAVIGRDKTVSLALLAGGALLIGAGVWLLPPPEQGPRIALLPSANGFALVGEWP